MFGRICFTSCREARRGAVVGGGAKLATATSGTGTAHARALTGSRAALPTPSFSAGQIARPAQGRAVLGESRSRERAAPRAAGARLGRGRAAVRSIAERPCPGRTTRGSGSSTAPASLRLAQRRCPMRGGPVWTEFAQLQKYISGKSAFIGQKISINEFGRRHFCTTKAFLLYHQSDV